MSGKAVKGILEAQILYIGDGCDHRLTSHIGSRMARFKAVGFVTFKMFLFMTEFTIQILCWLMNK